VSARLVNRVVLSALGLPAAHITDIDIQPHAGDAFDVFLTVSWPFVPAIKIGFTIEQQPQLPAAPVLVLRWSLFGAAGVIASRFLASLDRLPPGVRLDGDRLLVDIRRLAEHASAVSVLPYVKSLELHTVDGRFIVHLEMAVE
jgi:hypothetical protein